MSDAHDLRSMEWLWHVDIDLAKANADVVAKTARVGLQCLQNLNRDGDGEMLIMAIVKKPGWCCEKGRAAGVQVCPECQELFGSIPA